MAPFFGVMLLALSLIPFLLLVLPFSKVVPFAALVFFMASILTLPIHYAFFGYFLYLLFDGSLKLLSGYHPVLHVTQDIILLTIFIRSLSDHRTGGLSKIPKTPGFVIISIFTLWVLVQYLNPLGLGFLPSLAGSKIYLSAIAIYFIAYHHLDSKRRHQLVVWLVGLGTFEAVLATMEYLFFPEAIYGLSDSGALSYSTISGNVFLGMMYRPMGTTTLPGTPSSWISFIAPFATWLLIRKNTSIPVRMLALTFFIFGIPTLVFCQVRVSIVLSLMAIIAVAAYPRWGGVRRLGVASLGVVAIISLVVVIAKEMVPESLDAEAIANLSGVSIGEFTPEKAFFINSRLSKLADPETYTSVRGGATNAILTLSNETLFGIGLSRVSAASGPWLDRAAKDPYFGAKWAFADNLLRALFTELGLFGTIAWLAMVFTLLITLLKGSLKLTNYNSGYFVWACFAGAGVLVLGGLDTEGVLYNPMSAMIWIMLGLGMGERMAAAKERSSSSPQDSL